MGTASVVTKCGTSKFAASSPRDRKRRAVLLAVCGAAIGAVNGLFGAGGGMLAVPVLTYAAALGEKKAHATAIAVILPLCLVSAAVYAAGGNFDYEVLAPTVLGVLAGGVAGAAALKKLAVPVLNFLFYGLMLFAGIRMML